MNKTPNTRNETQSSWTTRDRLLTALGLTLTAIFLWLTLRDVAWVEIADAFRRATYWPVFPAALLVAADYWFRAVRWHHILAPTREIPSRRLFPVLIIGFAANNIVPARVGELWRVWGLSRQEDISKSVGLATLVVERVFDGLTLVFLLALYTLVAPLEGQARLMEYGFLALFGIALAGLLMLLFYEHQTIRLATLLMWPIPEQWRDRLLDMLQRFALGLHALRSPRRLFGVIVFSLAAWLSEAVAYYLFIIAFNLALSPLEMVGGAILLLTLINLGILLPSAPGYVGTYEYFGRLALVGVFGVAQEEAISVVILAHAVQYLLVTAIGLFFVARLGWQVAGVSQPAEPAGQSQLH